MKRVELGAVVILAVLIGALALAACDGRGVESSDSNAPSSASEAGESRQSDSRGNGKTSRGGGVRSPGGSEVSSGAARCYVEAVNDEDLDALVGCFAPDGVVVDVSRRIEGRDAIREWARNEVIGGDLRVTHSEARSNGERLLVHWAPAGSDGWRAYYTFEARGGLIVVANLQYA